jgi:hypothetical protein
LSTFCDLTVVLLTLDIHYPHTSFQDDASSDTESVMESDFDSASVTSELLKVDANSAVKHSASQPYKLKVCYFDR